MGDHLGEWVQDHAQAVTKTWAGVTAGSQKDAFHTSLNKERGKRAEHQKDQ